MSYTPRIIVEFNELKKLFDNKGITSWDTYDEDDARYHIRDTVMNNFYFDFKDLRLCILNPEFSSQNANLRKYLDKHKVYYVEYN